MLLSSTTYKLILLAALVVFTATASADAQKTGNYSRTTEVRVQGTGSNVDEAKKAAFRKAIEEAVGSVLLTTQEAQGDVLTKDQINEYSAGYIDNYEMLGVTHDESKQVVVDMNVRVASSKIAMRMLSSSNTITHADGERFQAALQSQLETREAGDKFLDEVLSSYPENAFLISSGQFEMSLTNVRQGRLTVPVTIKMSQMWLEGLDEALSVVSRDPTPEGCSKFLTDLSKSLRQFQMQYGHYEGLVQHNTHPGKCDGQDVMEPDIRVNYKKAEDWTTTSHAYNVFDLKTLEMINSHLGSRRLYLAGTLYGRNGATIDMCIPVPTDKFLYHADPKGVANLADGFKYTRPVFFGHGELNTSFYIDVNPDWVGKLDRVEYKLASGC